jgi:RNA polymerase sigma-70 factor (family 1)
MEPGTGVDITLLLQELKQGKESAFNTLYHMHSKQILSNIRKLVKNNEVSKELLQDLYLKVWERRDTIDVEKSFKSFLYTIAKHMVYNHLQRISLDKKARESLLQNAVESYSHTEEELDFRETNKLFRRAVETLPAQCRQVFTLSKLEGKTHLEISSELGISIKTVNNHMVKANKEVRAYLLRYGDEAVMLLVSLMLHNFR